jgi:hypothetical protein
VQSPPPPALSVVSTMSNSCRTRVSKPLFLLLLAFLLARNAEGSSRSQVMQTQSINVAWTVGLPCDHPWLRNATYSFMDQLWNATLQDLKATPGVRNVMSLGKGPCRDLVGVGLT